MNTIADDEWLIDLVAMTCRNKNSNITIGFEKKGKAIIGKVKDMPIEVMADWAESYDGAKLMQTVVLEAEEVFFDAYINNKLEMKREQRKKQLKSIN